MIKNKWGGEGTCSIMANRRSREGGHVPEGDNELGGSKREYYNA